MEVFILEEFVLNNLVPLLVILAGSLVSTACSMLDAWLSDAGPDSPLWKRALSKLVSSLAINVGKAKNDPSGQ